MKKKFLELCVEGLEDPDNIDDYIDQWHNGRSNLDLYDFLGFDDEKAYGQWMLNPNILDKLIKEMSKGR